MIHWSSVLSAPKSFESSGSATLTVTLFSRVITRLRLITARIFHLLSYTFCASTGHPRADDS